MKKKIVLLGAVAAASLATVSLASCKNSDNEPTTTESETSTKEEAKQTGISISGYKSSLILGGDIASTYKDAKVVANYSDGSTKDITDSVEFDTSKVNTSKVGPYPVYIKQGSYLTMYLVSVVDYTLESIEVDTTNFDTTLPLYSAFDFSSVVVKANYKNPADSTTNSEVVDHADVTFTVTDSANKVVSQLTAEGTYTVTVEFSGKTATFDLTCANPEVSTSVKDAVSQGVKSDTSVKSGSYTYTNGGSDYQIKKDYTIGSNFVKLAEENIYSGSSYGVTTTYFSVASNGSAFAVSVDEDGSASKYYGDHAANVADAKAVGFDFFEDGGTVYPQYGFASVIAALYARYEDTYSTESQVTKHETVEDVDGVKTYKFDFNDITNSSSAAHFTHYSVSFTLNAEGAIASANVSVEQYSLDDGYVVYNDLKSDGYTLPSELGLTLVKGEAVGGGEVYSFIIGDAAKVSSTNTYVVTQTSGEKLAASENPYASDKVAISSFNVSKLNDEGTYEEMIEGATYTDDLDYAVTSQDDGSHKFEFKLKIDGITPETANSDLDSVKISINGTAFDGAIVDSDAWQGYSYAYASSLEDGVCTLKFARAGEYTVTVSSILVTKTYKFSIKDEAPTKITPLLQDGEANSNFQTVETFECFTTNSLYLDCSIASYYTQGYKLSVLELVGEEYVATENASVKKDHYEVNGKNVECYKFTSTKAGEYKLVFTGATPDNPAKSAAEASIVVTVKDVPSVDDIVKGEHNYLFETTVSASEMYKVEFGAPDADNSGTITIWNKYDASKKQTGTYRYVDGQFVIDVESNTLGLADSATFDIEVTGYYGVKLKNSVTQSTYTLGAPTSDITDSELALLKGTYEAVSGTSTVTVKVTPSSDVKGDGSIEITVADGTSSTSGVYDYTFNCTTKTLDLTPSGESNPFSGTIKVSGDKLVYVAEGSSSEVAFVSKGINIDEICSGNYTVTDGNGVNYTIKFADSQVTIKNLSNSREKVCNYTYDESTGQLKLTKVSGVSKTVGVENYLYVIDGKLSYKGFKMGSSGTMEEYIAVCVKEGGSSTEVVTIPTAVQGTWYGTCNDTDYTVTIDSSKVKIVDSNDEEYSTYDVKFVKDNVITLSDGQYTLTLTVSSSSIAFDDGYLSMTLSKTRTYKTPAGYDGKWSGTSSDGYYTYDVTLTEGNTSVVIAVNDESTTCKITNISGNVITVAYGTYGAYDYSEYTLTLGDGSIELIDSYFGNTVTLTAGSTVTITFSEEFIGSWSTANSEYYITISTESISLNGNDGIIVNYTEDDNTYEIDIYGTSYYVSYADGHVTLMGSSGDRHTYALYKIPTGSFYVDKSGENAVIYVGSTTVAFDDYEYTISSIEVSDSGDLTIIATDSGSSDYQVKLTVVNGVVTGYAETSNGGSDWETYEVVTASAVTFSEIYIGTWSNSDESSTLVITEDTVTYNGTEVEVTGDATDGYSFETTNAAGHTVTAYFWIEGETLTVSINANFVDYTKKN